MSPRPEKVGMGRSGGGAVGIIPARFASTRFPGKAIAPILGKPMIQWVYERASLSRRLDRVVVATDDDRIASAVRGFGGDVVMTGSDCSTGMDRCAEAAASLDGGIVVDIQGDEPLLRPGIVDLLVDAIGEAPWAAIATPYRRCVSSGEYRDPDRVKLVLSCRERVLYFSRSSIPHGLEEPGGALIHIGIYSFRRDALLELGRAPRGRLEQAESLEQLRALEAGMAIRGVRCEAVSVGVDRPGDIQRVEEELRRGRSGGDVEMSGGNH